MDSSLQYQAVLNLLHLCDEDTPATYTNTHSNPEYNILTDHSLRSNTITNHQKFNNTIKIRTEAIPSIERTANSTQNKQNLKKILEKLKDSPSPAKKKGNKKEKEIFHIKTTNSQPQSRTKQLRKTPEPIQKSLKKLMQRDKQKDLIKSLVKAKIVQKLKLMEEKKTHRQFRQESFKISTVRQMQCIKRGQIALQTDKKDNNSYYNLLREERSANISTLLNGRCSRVNLNHLLF